MKIGKRALLVLGAVVIAAAIVVVGMLYFRQAGERAALSERLDRAETLLAGITRNRSDLEDQLASAQSSLETNRAKFPESVQSIEYGEYLFEIADACNVALDNLVFPTSATRTVGGVTYSVISLSLPISGTLEDVFKFIDTIRTDDRFASTDVKSINMNTGDSTTISMDIYGYEG